MGEPVSFGVVKLTTKKTNSVMPDLIPDEYGVFDRHPHSNVWGLGGGRLQAQLETESEREK